MIMVNIGSMIFIHLYLRKLYINSKILFGEEKGW